MDHELVAHAGAQHLARASGGGVAEVLEGQVAACALGEDVGAVRGEALDLALDGRADRVAGHELDERQRLVVGLHVAPAATAAGAATLAPAAFAVGGELGRSEEHTSELQSLMRISYAVFCLKKQTTNDKSSGKEWT